MFTFLLWLGVVMDGHLSEPEWKAARVLEQSATGSVRMFSTADDVFIGATFTADRETLLVCYQPPYCFAISRDGQRLDPMIQESGGDQDQYETGWSAAVSNDAKGWSVEMRIPRRIAEGQPVIVPDRESPVRGPATTAFATGRHRSR